MVMRIDLDVKGRENLAKIDWSRPVIVIANHSSFSDIPAVLVSVQRHLGFLAKAELARIPVLYYWMKKIGCIFIERQAAGAGRKFMDKINECIAEKPPQIVIFPEGTRSKTGEMGEWKFGAFKIAAELKATILPVALQGTAVSWEKRTNSKTIQKAIAQILEPFDIAKQGEVNVKEVKNKMFQELNSFCAAATPFVK
jgi:1-acyl-sn-glycerol-3-phosphate acyltransferase